MHATRRRRFKRWSRRAPRSFRGRPNHGGVVRRPPGRARRGPLGRGDRDRPLAAVASVASAARRDAPATDDGRSLYGRPRILSTHKNLSEHLRMHARRQSVEPGRPGPTFSSSGRIRRPTSLGVLACGRPSRLDFESDLAAPFLRRTGARPCNPKPQHSPFRPEFASLYVSFAAQGDAPIDLVSDAGQSRGRRPRRRGFSSLLNGNATDFRARVVPGRTPDFDAFGIGARPGAPTGGRRSRVPKAIVALTPFLRRRGIRRARPKWSG
jgi:hypothetical protein